MPQFQAFYVPQKQQHSSYLVICIPSHFTISFLHISPPPPLPSPYHGNIIFLPQNRTQTTHSKTLIKLPKFAFSFFLCTKSHLKIVHCFSLPTQHTRWVSHTCFLNTYVCTCLHCYLKITCLLLTKVENKMNKKPILITPSSSSSPPHTHTHKNILILFNKMLFCCSCASISPFSPHHHLLISQISFYQFSPHGGTPLLFLVHLMHMPHDDDMVYFSWNDNDTGSILSPPVVVLHSIIYFSFVGKVHIGTKE